MEDRGIRLRACVPNDQNARAAEDEDDAAGRIRPDDRVPIQSGAMSCLSVSYDSFLPPGAIFKEFKMCEGCGYSFCREIGNKNSICFQCHKEWNEKVLELPGIQLVTLEEVFEPEIEAAPKRSCRVKRG